MDALAEIGSKRAVPRLFEMLRGGNAKRAAGGGSRASASSATRARSICSCRCSHAARSEIRVEAIGALARLADEGRAEQIRAQLQGQAAQPDSTVARAAVRALTELDNALLLRRQRPGGGRRDGGSMPEPAGAAAAPASNPPARC